MRKPEREITDPREIDYVLDKALVCRVAMCQGGEPYVVPMNFGRGQGCLYLHCAPKGRKVEILRLNPRVCFEMETDVAVVEGDKPCDFTARFRCVIGTGTAVFLEDRAERLQGLDAIMRHYLDQEGFAYREKVVDMVAVIRVDIDHLSGKRHGLD